MKNRILESFKTLLGALVLLALSLFTQQGYGQELLLQTGHFGKVYLTQTLEDGRTMVSGGEDGRILFWDIKSRIQTKSINVFNNYISTFSYHSGKNLLAVGSYDGYFKLYDLNKSDSIPIVYHKNSYQITALDINLDASLIATGSADFSLKIIKNGEIQAVVMEDDITAIQFTPDGKKLFIASRDYSIYTWEVSAPFTKENIKKYFTAGSNISDMVISRDGKLLAYGCAGYGDINGELGVLQIKNKKQIHKSFNYAITLGFKPNTLDFIGEDLLLFQDTIEFLKILNFKTNQISNFVEEEVSTFTYSPILNAVVYPIKDEIVLKPLEENSQVLIYKGYVSKPVKLLGANKDSLFVEYSNGVVLWDLAALTQKLYKEKLYENDWGLQAFSPDLIYELHNNSYFLSKQDNYGVILLKHKNPLQIVFSKDGNMMAQLNDEGHFQITKMSDKLSSLAFSEPVFYSKFSNIEASNIDCIEFNEKGNRVLVAERSKSYMMELDSMKKRRFAYNYRNTSFTLPGFFHPTNNEIWLGSTIVRYDSFPFTDTATGWNYIERNNLKTGEVLYENRLSGIATRWSLNDFEYAGYIYNDVPNKFKINELVKIIHQEKTTRILFFYTDNSVAISSAIDPELKEWEVLNLPCFGIESVLQSYDSKFIYVSTSEGTILVLDANTLKVKCTLYSLTNGEYFIMDTEHYFKRSKNISNAVAFKEGNGFARINTYDAFFNKPYKVMESLGLESKEKIELVKKLAKANEKKIFKTEAPKIQILNENKITIKTNENFVLIKYQVTSSSELENIKIRVNGVPIADPSGELDKIKGLSSYQGSINVPLTWGMNNIAISVMDNNQQESEIKIFSITSNMAFRKPNLHLIVLSVSEYENTQYNLKYAVKDGLDFVHTFVNKKGNKILGFPNTFNKIIVDTLLNANATKENYLKLEKKLLESNPEDYVYIYVSGHGLLDDNYDFWFATYDVNFDKPSEKGLSFQAIENLLLNIPARQRLILMDACHSGEVLKDEITTLDTVDLPFGAKGQVVGYTYRGTQVEDMGEEIYDLSELKQSLFSNYNSKSGATVISAAAGNSYALESEEWNNGIFTYSILAGLTERLADLDNNGEVTVIELSKFVNKEVKERTNGRQIPNDRQENSENNFRLW